MINIYDKNETHFTHNGLAILNDCKSCFITQELNGGYSLEIEVVKDTKGKYKFIQPFNIIKADNQLFRIPTIENIQDTGITIKTYANQISYDLYSDWVENTTITNVKVDQALQTIITNPKFTVIPTDITDVNSITLQSVNPVQGVFNILDTWGGELYRDNFNIGIKQTIGADNSILVKYGKNILGFNQRIDTTNIVTRIIPIGANGLTIESINNGVKYLDSPKINDYPYPITREIKFENETDAASLMAIALKLWGVIDTPEVNYAINFVELSKIQEYKDYAILETVNLGDQVIVRHSVFDVDIKLKVIKIKKDVLRNKIVEIELGSMKKSIADYVNGLQKNIDTTNIALDTTNTNLSNLTDTVDTLSLTVDQTNESLTITAQDLRDADNALDGKIDITATSLTSDYSQKISTVDGKVETNTSDITQNAQNIELKVAKDGIINAINLSAEALTIDVNKIDISNAVIGWTQLNGAPTDNTALATTLNSYVSNSSLATELASYITTGTFSNTLQNYVTGSGLTTILGQDYIITGKLLTNQIDAGQLNGVTIRTSNTTNYVTMQDQYIDIYNGDTKKIHIGYDYWNGTSYEASLEFENNKIYANSSGFRFQPGGASCLFMYNDGTAAFGNDLKITGDLEVLGAVSFPTSTFTVTAKFA